MDKKNILVVDDEPKILEVVASYLESRGCGVFTAENGARALAVFGAENISLVLLDLMLPDVPGEEVIAAIRRSSRAPVIMLTAKSDEDSILAGFSLGADDYITKPFGLKELYARVEAVLRRTAGDLVPLTLKSSFGNGDLTVDFGSNSIKKAGRPVSLTPSELRLLAALIKYPSRVFSRGELIDAAFGEDFDGYDRAVDSHVKNLRQKIEDDPRNPRYVLTVHGLGYRFGGGA
ncbi:MAG: response regulator transcription factor [Oscillospiraceae bacterium]|jgi:DNA-binding response OmpR family regulator|nr:response regulator transcription factor [Oscillospiraceae bacterium]